MLKLSNVELLPLLPKPRKKDMAETKREEGEKVRKDTANVKILVVDIVSVLNRHAVAVGLHHAIEKIVEEMIGTKERKSLGEGVTLLRLLGHHLKTPDAVIERTRTKRDLMIEREDIHPLLLVQKKAAALIVDEL